MIGNSAFLHSLDAKEFVTDKFGLPTIKDILKELEKPGRDPRASFQTAQFKEGVESLKDLKEDMILEGIVTNVANFGAFVDIGVHQDGLVHISQLSNEFVKDPRNVVKTGQIVKVKVLEVDIPRKRISLSMCLEKSTERAPKSAPREQREYTGAKHSPSKSSSQKHQKSAPREQQTGSLGLLLEAALKGKK